MGVFDNIKDAAQDAIEKIRDNADEAIEKVKDATDDASIEEYSDKAKDVAPDQLDAKIDTAADKAQEWNDRIDPGTTTPGAPTA